MLLVADSGSTKCDWILVKSTGERLETSTMGFNPLFHTSELIESELNKNELLNTYKKEVRHVYFFGASASSDARIAIVAEGLKRVFDKADVNVDHDVKAAVIATAQDAPGIVCILGTGSNSCYTDGKEIHEKIPALGYILGDEGSGAYFGKSLLSKYLYKKLPVDLAAELEKDYNVSKESIFNAVYKQPNANVYLASYMKFAHKNQNHPFFKELIYKGLSEFINLHVWCFDNFREVPVHFVGSIAFYFREVLEEVAKNYRFTIGKIIKKPVTSLADYFCSKLSYPII